MFEALLELPIIILSIGFLETTLTMVFIIENATLITSTICPSDNAFSVLLYVLTKTSFIDISILIPEYTFPIFLSTLETALITVSALITHFSFTIEDPIHERTLIVEAFPAALHLH